MKSFLSLVVGAAFTAGLAAPVSAAPLPVVSTLAPASAVGDNLVLAGNNGGGPPIWKVPQGAGGKNGGGRSGGGQAVGRGGGGPRGAPVGRAGRQGGNGQAIAPNAARKAPIGRGGNPPKYAGGDHGRNGKYNNRRYNNYYYNNRYYGRGWYGGYWGGYWGPGWGYRAGYRNPYYNGYGYGYGYGYGNGYYNNGPAAVVVTAQPSTVAVVIKPWTPQWYRYCSQKYRSFNPKTGYFTAYSGRKIFCTP